MRAILTLAATLLVSAVSAQAASKGVLAELNRAYQAEFTADHRYEDYAAKAQAEGYGQVAKLFRAACRAERIHRDGLKVAIVELGGTPETPAMQEIQAGTTRENLAKVVEGETDEATEVYPALLKRVKREKDGQAAARILKYALAAETEHAQLFKEALAHLGHNKEAAYFVCPVCSRISQNLPEKKCRGCGGEKTPIAIE